MVLLISILLYLPLLAAAADGLVLVGLTRRSHFPPPALVKRQDANATGTDASEPSSNSTRPPPGIIPNGNSTGGNETIGNPQGSSNGPVSNDTGSRATTVGHEALTGLLGTTYLAMNVSVGTPEQDMLVAVALDEAGDLRLVGCNGTTCLQAQGGGKVFDSSKSTSFKTENRTGGDGTIAADTVTVGGVSVVDQPFILQTDPSSNPAGGRISFGLKHDNATLGGTPFYRALSKAWPKQEFGLFVAPLNLNDPQQQPLENSGELALGGLNPALYTGEVKYLPTTGDGWAVPLHDILLDGKSIMPAAPAAPAAGSQAAASPSPAKTSALPAASPGGNTGAQAVNGTLARRQGQPQTTDAPATSAPAGAANETSPGGDTAPAAATTGGAVGEASPGGNTAPAAAATTPAPAPAVSPGSDPASAAPAPAPAVSPGADAAPAPAPAGASNSTAKGTAALWLNGGSLLSEEIGGKLVAAIPGANRSESTAGNSTSVAYMVPCDTKATLSFDLGGQKIDLPPSAWVYKFPGGGEKCAAFFGPIIGTYGYGNDTSAVLGLNVLQTVYTAFKLAPANGTNSSQALVGAQDVQGPMIGFAALSEAAKGVKAGNDSSIPGATENPAVTATGAGVSASAPAETGASGAQKVVVSAGAVLFAAALVFVAL